MDEKTIAQYASEKLATLGLELDRIEIRKAGNRKMLRICVDGDGENGQGPSLADISRATTELSQGLDELPQLGNSPYILEVSSRGVTQPLKEAKHYRRNLGRLVKITLSDDSVLTKRIKAVDEIGVVFEDEEKISYQDIKTAVIQVELR